MHEHLSSFLDLLRREGQLIEIDAPVAPYLEIAEIHRRVIATEGPALLFRNVKGSAFPVVTNLFGTLRRVEMAFGTRPERFVQEAVHTVHHAMDIRWHTLWQKRHWIGEALRLGTKTSQHAPILEAMVERDPLQALPALTSWPEDGGPFLTLPLVYTEHPQTKQHNLGMYRVHVYDGATTGMHWQIHKGGGFHHHVAEQLGQPLPTTVYLGGPPALIAAAIAPLPENVPELLLTSLLMGKKLPLVANPYGGHRLIAHAEFAIEGVVLPHVRRQEGPFGDHYGYYSLAHPFPTFHVKRMWHRREAIYPATIVGKPRQEDYYIGEYLQSLLSPLFPVVMPSVKQLWTYAESGFHPLAAAVVRERYAREALGTAFRILGEGQLSLTKVLFITDQSVPLSSFSALLTAVLQRLDPQQDVLVLDKTAHDTLDYTGDRLNHGSKMIWIGVGESKRTLPEAIPTAVYDIAHVLDVQCFSPGCLVVSGPSYRQVPDFATHLERALRTQHMHDWPLVFVVDDATATVQNQTAFLWRVFTRFNPARDTFVATTVRHHHVSYAFPFVIDARMKPGYPDELFPAENTVKTVDAQWKTYFPQGMEG